MARKKGTIVDYIENAINNKALKKKLGHKCVYCGCTNPLILTIDHKIPLIRKGKDTDANKQVVCMPCNHLKDALTHKEFKVYFRCLKELHKLCKISMKATPVLKFNYAFYPGYRPLREVEKVT